MQFNFSVTVSVAVAVMCGVKWYHISKPETPSAETDPGLMAVMISVCGIISCTALFEVISERSPRLGFGLTAMTGVPFTAAAYFLFSMGLHIAALACFIAPLLYCSAAIVFLIRNRQKD